MITDFNAIKSEKDRAFYVDLRNVLDNFFITRIHEHDEKDHVFAECEQIIELLERLDKEFPKELRQECRDTQLTEIEVIENWIHHNESHMIMYMCGLIQLNKEYNKRKQ